MAVLAPSTRVRPSPFHNCVLAEGVSHYTVYNRMLLPTGYGDAQREYDALINSVQLWDVSVQRQVEINGPDAGRLVQIISPRDMSKCKIGQGKYVPLCDHRGTIINDPIILKLSDTRYWISIADSDITYWARAIGAERGLDAEVFEADVSPLAIQGPKAEDVVASLFGEKVRAMKYFWFTEETLQGIPLMLARSGWSKQGGFELYLMDETKGEALWNILREAGAPWNITPGYPNSWERIESGLISWGGDTDDQTNPFELRMGNYVDLDVDDEVVSIKALRKIHAEGPKRHSLGIKLTGTTPLPAIMRWADVTRDGQPIGHMTNSVFSPRLQANIGYGLLASDTRIGDEIEVDMSGTKHQGVLTDIPFY